MTGLLGSLFTGTGALDMAISAVTGAETAFVADVCGDPKSKHWPHRTPHKSPCTILAHRFPGVPNLGDVSAIDWTPWADLIDILCAGFPCQDVSTAGKRAGLKTGTRTGLWSEVVRAITELRPRLVVLENVPGIFTAPADGDVELCSWCVGDGPDGYALHALDAVLADLAEVGFDAEWVCVPASGVGAPHKRLRWFLTAYPAGQPWSFDHGDRSTPADSGGSGRQRVGSPQFRGSRGNTAGDCSPVADTDDNGRRKQLTRRRQQEDPRVADTAEPVADASGDGRNEGRTESAGFVGGSDASERDRADDGLTRAQIFAGDWGDWPLLPTVNVRNNENRQSEGYGPNLGEALKLLKTPTTQLAVNGGSQHPDKRKSGGHGPTLADEVEHLLPTPAAHEPGGSVEQYQERLRRHDGRESTFVPLSMAVELLPTPSVALADGGQTSRSGTRKDELLLGGIVASSARFGQYAPAIARWESVIGPAAPSPTEPTGRGGAQRLSPRFTEWMMGLPDGWIADVPGITRNEVLKASGNGVVLQQAVAAVSYLLNAGVAV